MKTKHCCEQMKEHVESLEINEDTQEWESGLIFYSEVYDEYGIIVYDVDNNTHHYSGHSYVLMEYCPWCGCKLPDSKKDQWFDELRRLGFEDPDSEDIPDKYRTDEWRL